MHGVHTCHCKLQPQHYFMFARLLDVKLTYMKVVLMDNLLWTAELARKVHFPTVSNTVSEWILITSLNNRQLNTKYRVIQKQLFYNYNDAK